MVYQLIIAFSSGFLLTSVIDWFYYSKKERETLKKGMEHAYMVGWNSCNEHIVKQIDKSIKEQESK